MGGGSHPQTAVLIIRKELRYLKDALPTVTLTATSLDGRNRGRAVLKITDKNWASGKNALISIRIRNFPTQPHRVPCVVGQRRADGLHMDALRELSKSRAPSPIYPHVIDTATGAQPDIYDDYARKTTWRDEAKPEIPSFLPICPYAAFE